MMSGPPCQSYWNTPAVFSGRVLDIQSKQAQSDIGQFTYERKLVKFAVEDAFRGVQASTVEVLTGQGGGDCGYNFEQGRSYLVYAHKNETGEMSTGICTRTRPIEKAAEDLEFIRGIDKMSPTARFSGGVIRYKPRRSDDDRTEPELLSGLSVELTYPTSKFTVKTDEEGRFKFNGLPPGQFQLKIIPPSGYWPTSIDKKLTIPAKGCFEIGFAFELDSSVSGRVMKADGTPASNIGVNLVHADQINADHQADPHYATTDDEGRFVIRGLPAGSYYLGIRLWRVTDSDFPYPRTFYPGVAKIEEAAVITVSDGRPQTGLNFQLPEPLKMRRIEGVVVMADGKPATNFHLYTKEIEYARGGGFNDGKGVETGPDGKFSIVRPDKIAFSVYAYVDRPDGQQMHAAPIEVRSAGDQKGLRFVIDHPGGSCEKCRKQP
jgi:hypothetical protein